MAGRHLTLVALGALALGACTSSSVTPTPAPTPASTPVLSPTSGSTPSPVASASPAGSVPPGSSPPSSASPPASASPSPTAAIASLPPELGLEEREWLLVRISDGSFLNEVPQGLSATISLTDGLASGDAGCNTFRAPYTIQGQAIVFGRSTTTRMACDAPAMALETNYLQQLSGVARYGALDTGMAFFSPPGAPILAYVPAPTGSIVGDWSVTRYQDARGAIVAPIEGSRLTLTMRQDGTLSGADGCNDFTGSYTIDGPRLSLSSLSGTRAACADSDLAAQEEAFLEALQGSQLWTATPDALTFRGQDGLLTVGLERSGPG